MTDTELTPRQKYYRDRYLRLKEDPALYAEHLRKSREAMKRYYERIKADPVLYDQYLRKCRDRSGSEYTVLRAEEQKAELAAAHSAGFASVEEYADHLRRQRRREYIRLTGGKRGTPARRFQCLRARHRARAAGVGGDTTATLTHKEFADILERQGHRCLRCQREFSEGLPWTVDHIVPVRAGGALVKENVQALCQPCNTARSREITMQLNALWLAS